jgi:hypothetical protein
VTAVTEAKRIVEPSRAGGDVDTSDFSVSNAFQGEFDGLSFDNESLAADPFSWFT